MNLRHIARDATGRETVTTLRQVPLHPAGADNRLVVLTKDELSAATTLAVKRDKGMGDLLMLTPVFRKLRRLYPQLQITLYCCDWATCLFDHNPDVTAKPIDLYEDEADDHDLQIDLVCFAERSPVADCLDRTSIFAKAFDLALEDGFPLYYVTDEEAAAADAALVGCPRPWVAVAPIGNEGRRMWCDPGLGDLTRGLLGHGCTVFPVNQTADLQNAPYFQHNRVRPQWAVPLRRLAALMARMDAVVSVDSGVYHLAAAAAGRERQPLLAVLMGSLAPHLRLSWYDPSRTVEVRAAQECPHWPCYYHTPYCIREAGERYQCMSGVSGKAALAAVVAGLGMEH